MRTLTCVFEHCQAKINQRSTLKYARFVKPNVDLRRANRWISLVGRTDFGISAIDQWTIVCEKHFPYGVKLNWRTNQTLEPFPRPMKTVQLVKPPIIEPELRVLRTKNVKSYGKNRIVKRITLPVPAAVTNVTNKNKIDLQVKQNLRKLSL